jgi:hypothetical protein
LSWIERGRAKGELIGARTMLLLCIRVRLVDPVPDDIALAIECANDPQILDEWFKVAIRVQDITELRNAMKTE